jgi:phosphatidylserine/phosphatidylglycerophosphate/cardiolipin synthase-like enzyme
MIIQKIKYHVQGSVVGDESGAGLPQLTLRLMEDADHDLFLAETVTDASGAWQFDYEANKPAFPLNYQIRVYNAALRILYDSPAQQLTSPTTSWPTIRIKKAQMSGWLVTQVASNPTRVSFGNKLELLVDNEQAWTRIVDAAGKVTTKATLFQYYWDINQCFMHFEPPLPVEHQPTQLAGLESSMTSADKRGPATRILMQKSVSVPPDDPTGEGKITFYPLDSSGVVKEYFDTWAQTFPASKVHFSSLSRFIVTPVHGKLFVADGTAFLLGSPFIQDFFDSPKHSILETRRGALASATQDIKLPIHDVSLAVTGPAVTDVDAFTTRMWDHANSNDTTTPDPDPGPLTPGAGEAVQIVVAIPRNEMKWLPNGETGTLEAYQRAIEQAQQYIYLENQYFAEGAILEMLRKAIETKPSLQVIMLATYPDVSLIANRQNLFFKDLDDLVQKKRIGVFTRWSHEPGNGKEIPQAIILRNYIHAKVGVVDDKWVTIGSANLDGASMDQVMGELFEQRGTNLAALRRLSNPRLHRSFELNAVVYNGVGGMPASTFPDLVRRTLFAEHLGLDPGDPSLKTAPANGWLQLWNDAAEQKAAHLVSNPSTPHQAHVLKWVPTSNAKKYLTTLGVNTDNLRVLSEAPGFDLQSSTWPGKPTNEGPQTGTYYPFPR